MPFQQHKALRFWTFESFERMPLKHAVFTRRCGTSKGHLKGLNLSRAVGDSEPYIRENEELAFDALGLSVDSAADSLLEHGTRAIYADAPFATRNGDERRADILMTDRSDVTLFMRYADCLPILLYDKNRQAMALAHAGWKGTVSGVAAKSVAAMTAQFGSRPKDLFAAIGPGICAVHYEVGEEVLEAVEDYFGNRAKELLPVNSGRVNFDLLKANRISLEDAGVRQIEESGLCTAENLDDWFSHRGENGKTGRFGVLMALATQ